MTLPKPKENILQISPYQPGKSKAAGARIIKLASNENPHGPSPKALEAFRNSAAALYRYPDGGATDLRAAIAEVYGLDAARIVCGAGSDELISLLIGVFAGPGDEVLYSQHGFLMYKIYAQLHGATPVTAPETNLRTDIAAIAAAVTPRTKIVFIANPNNPTGSYITRAELAELRRNLPEHVILAVDAAYAEYVEAEDYSNGLELATATENTVMLRTFSKIYGLATLRLGWGYFPAAIADALNRARSPFNISTPAMLAGIAAVRDVEYTAFCRADNARELARVSAAVAALGLIVHPSVGNFVLIEFPSAGKTASAANAYFMERGIIPREVGGYGLPRHLRISIGVADENQAMLETLTAFMQS